MNRIKKIPPILFILVFILLSTFSIYAQDKSMVEIQKAMKRGSYNRALTLLDNYIRRNPDSLNAYIMAVHIHLNLGGPKHEDAAEYLVYKSLDRSPENTTLMKLMSEIKRKQQKVNAAMEWLERIIEVDPADQQTFDLLIEYYTKTGDKEKLESLQRSASERLSKITSAPMSYLSAGKSEVTLKNSKKAIAILTKGIELFPDNPSLHKALCDAYLLDGQKVPCCEEYYRWLEKETDPVPLDLEFRISTLFMSTTDTTAFNAFPFGEKANFIIKFWRMNDPYPFTPENERLYEHLNRIKEAKKKYSTKMGDFGFDDRGKVYIRWGPPEESYAEDVTDQFILLRSDDQSLWNNESWYYPSINEYLAFDFIDIGGYYKEVSTLIQAVYEKDRTAVREIYRRRVRLGGIYEKIAYETEDNFSLMNENLTKIIEARKISEPQYKLTLPFSELKFDYRAAQFRGKSGKTRLDIAYGIPLRQFHSFSTKDSIITLQFQTDFAFLDSNEGKSFHSTARRTYERIFHPDYVFENYVGEEQHEATSGNSKIALQIVEKINEMGTYKIESLNIRNFQNKSLMMSDLKLSEEIRHLATDSLYGIELISLKPYPFLNINQRQNIYLYFEVYNLALSSEHRTNYEISLKMEQETEKGGFTIKSLSSFGKIISEGKPQEIETSYQRQGNNSIAVEYVELDLSKLNKSISRLTVIVKDLNIAKSVENNIEFELQ